MKVLKKLLILTAVLFSGLATTSCVESKPRFVDYVHDGSVKLEYDYKGRDFYKDGIGQVEFKTAIDGDTAHFYPVVKTTSKEAIKARYFGVDTPESTGKVQPYGKPASNFNKEKLLSAAANGTIVVSSAQDGYGLPNADSTGERYVSLIWIHETKKDAPYDELVLLNLWIVQEGFSWVKNAGNMPQYTDTFYKAEQQAKNFALNLHSGLPDGSFNYGDYEDVSLLDVKIELEKTFADPNYENAFNNRKIRVVGTVTGYSNHILYIQNFYSQENGARVPEGEYAGINIFVGMSTPASKYTKVNTYIQICGLAQYTENFGFQMTDTEGHFPIVESTATENDCKILIKPEDNTDEFEYTLFEKSSSELTTMVNTNNIDCLFGRVSVTNEVTCSSVYINNSGDEFTLSFQGCTWEVYIAGFKFKGDPEHPNYAWTTKEDFIGKKFSVEGIYSYHQYMSGSTRKIDFQIVVGKDSLVWIP